MAMTPYLARVHNPVFREAHGEVRPHILSSLAARL
jgi:hypothetical protein